MLYSTRDVSGKHVERACRPAQKSDSSALEGICQRAGIRGDFICMSAKILQGEAVDIVSQSTNTYFKRMNDKLYYDVLIGVSPTSGYQTR